MIYISIFIYIIFLEQSFQEWSERCGIVCKTLIQIRTEKLRNTEKFYENDGQCGSQFPQQTKEEM